MRDFNLSFSLIKSYQLYKNGHLCGIQFNEVYLKKKHKTETSNAGKLGHYFEYKATGSKPRYGEVPEPKILASGANKGKPSADFDRANRQAEKFKTLCDAMGIEIVEVGLYIKNELRWSGEVDILARPKKGVKSVLDKLTIIDLKYTGLMNNKWDGWAIDNLDEKEDKVSQSDHYKILVGEKYKEPVDFVFWLFSSGTDEGTKFIKVNHEEGRLTRYAEDANIVHNQLEMDLELDSFRAYPNYNSCNSCPLLNECDKARKIPDVDEITLC